MRDGGAERSRRRPLGVEMNPLMIVGRVREGCDPLLGYLPPLAVAEMFPDQVLQIGDATDRCCHRFPLVAIGTRSSYPMRCAGSRIVVGPD